MHNNESCQFRILERAYVIFKSRWYLAEKVDVFVFDRFKRGLSIHQLLIKHTDKTNDSSLESS